MMCAQNRLKYYIARDIFEFERKNETFMSARGDGRQGLGLINYISSSHNVICKSARVFGGVH